MDKKYWNNFYTNHRSNKDISEASTFANFCQKEIFINNSYNIVELGAGNGRDAMFFAKLKHKVVAVDQCVEAINKQRTQLSEEIQKNICVKEDDFVRENYCVYGHADVFYSRFSLHAIRESEESIVLLKVYDSLRTGGLFCIEARTINDQLFGVGTDLGNNTFYTDHSRRFINSDSFLKKALNIGYTLKYFTEKDNLSIYKDDNPVLMRIILQK